MTKKKFSKKGKKAVAVGVASAVCASLLAVGGSVAYFSDTATAENVYHVNSSDKALDVEVVEEAWDPDAALNWAPLQSVAKDPKIVNNGELGAYGFVRVSIPLYSGDISTAEGVDEAVDGVDLFTYEVNEGWIQVETPSVQDGKRVYTYAYENEVAPGGETPSLFDAVTMINIANTVEDLDGSITVEVHGMQAIGFDSAQQAWGPCKVKNHLA